MAKVPKTDVEYVRSLERRIARLERALMPWQLTVGRYGDLVADNLQTGRRVTLARKQTQPQNEEGSLGGKPCRAPTRSFPIARPAYSPCWVIWGVVGIFLGELVAVLAVCLLTALRIWVRLIVVSGPQSAVMFGPRPFHSFPTHSPRRFSWWDVYIVAG